MKIVFPEGMDERILQLRKISEGKCVTPILIGNIEEVQAKAKQLNVSLEALKYMIHKICKMDEMVAAFVERRKGKATEEQARKILLDENYFGTMLV